MRGLININALHDVPSVKDLHIVNSGLTDFTGLDTLRTVKGGLTITVISCRCLLISLSPVLTLALRLGWIIRVMMI
jgi:hypothetical protein